MRSALVSEQALSYQASGLTGSTAASRYCGGTASGAPTTGAHLVGDFVIAQNGHIWICTVAGTPGTWVDAGAGGGVTMATSVVSETTYGIAAAVGTSTNAARQDHTHGSPATPVTSAIAGTGIGVAGSTGAVIISNTGATSVAGRTGAVVLTAADVAAGTFPGAAYLFAGAIQVTQVSATGLTGSTAASRYVGATTSGAPTTGAHNVGDFVIAQDGHIWVCRAAGTPGTWADVAVGVLGSSVVSLNAVAGGADPGTASTASRSDHIHAITNAVDTVSNQNVAGVKIFTGDAQVNDGTTTRSVPRGKIFAASRNATQSLGTNTETLLTGANDMSVVVPTGGRTYVIAVDWQVASTSASDTASFRVRDGGASAPTTASTTISGPHRKPMGAANTAWSVGFVTTITLAAGTHRLGLSLITTGGSGTAGATTAGQVSTVGIFDEGV